MKKIISFILIIALVSSFSLCFAIGETSSIKYEAENADLVGGLKVDTDIAGYSGDGYVGKFSSDSQKLDITISVSETARYDIVIRNTTQGAYKSNNLYLDGQFIANIESEEVKGWQDTKIEAVKIEKGEHTLSIQKSWGWIWVDYVTVTKGVGISNEIYDIDYELSNPNASQTTKRLWQYLCDNYGVNIISGQYTDKGYESDECKAILEATGEAPAIWGFDMMGYSPSRVSYGEKCHTVDSAISWAKEHGGIVTFCWHWTPDRKYLGANGEAWWSGFYTKATSFDFKAAMNGGDEYGYNSLIADIDAIAVQLKRLQDEDIPVMWRPLHEASGGWFWWGTDRDSYLKLWNLLYDRLTNYHKLNNLIWVWNGQDADWYPGDKTVDIIGEDVYPDKKDTSSQMARFIKAKNYTNPSKMICLSENGTIPDIDNCIDDNAMWSWFATWGGNFTVSGGKLSSAYTPTDIYKKIYQSDRVITLSEVPDIWSYPITNGYEYTGGGDINADGTLDIIDVVLARGHIVGNFQLSAEQISNGDMNGDTVIDIVDVALMRKAIVTKA